MSEGKLNKRGDKRGINGLKPIMIDPSLRGMNKMKLNRDQKEKMTTMLVEMILCANKKSELIQAVIANAPEDKKLNVTNAESLIRFAKNRIIDLSDDSKVIINAHVILYERIFNYFHSIGHTKGMNKALRAKEVLLGIIKPRKNKVTINQTKNVKIIKEVIYDLEKLNYGEQKRLKELLTKAK